MPITYFYQTMTLTYKFDRYIYSFWHIVVHKKDRPIDMKTWICTSLLHLIGIQKKIIPYFIGFGDKPTWPLSEEYSKWMLILFKPWRNSIDTLKGSKNTFANVLWTYMLDSNFPSWKRSEILYVQLNITGFSMKKTMA